MLFKYKFQVRKGLLRDSCGRVGLIEVSGVGFVS